MTCLKTKPVFWPTGLKRRSCMSANGSKVVDTVSKTHAVNPLLVLAKDMTGNCSCLLTRTLPASPNKHPRCGPSKFWEIKASKHMASSNWLTADVLGHQWLEDLNCIRFWNSLPSLWVLGCVSGTKGGKALADCKANSSSLTWTCSVCLVWRTLESKHALNFWTLERWLCLLSLKESLAVWWVFSIHCVSPRLMVKVFKIAWACQVLSKISLSFKRNATLQMDSLIQDNDSRPEMNSPWASLLSKCKIFSQSFFICCCIFLPVERSCDKRAAYFNGGLQYWAINDMDLLATSLEAKSKWIPSLCFRVSSDVAIWGYNSFSTAFVKKPWTIKSYSSSTHPPKVFWIMNSEVWWGDKHFSALLEWWVQHGWAMNLIISFWNILAEVIKRGAKE